MKTWILKRFIFSKTSSLEANNFVQKPSNSSSILEQYQNCFTIWRFFGSTCFDIINTKPQHLQSQHDNKRLLAVSKNSLTLFKYYLTKILFVIYLGFFISRFTIVVLTKDSKSAHCYFKEKGSCLLAISCYIIEQCMVLGIYWWAHRKQNNLCNFINVLNNVDCYIFGAGMSSLEVIINFTV